MWQRVLYNSVYGGSSGNIVAGGDKKLAEQDL